MYKVHLKSPTGEAGFVFYDPLKNTFLSAGKQPLLGQPEMLNSPVDQVSPDNPVGKTGAVKRLKIQLGLKCNYSCSYCLQSSKIPDANVTRTQDAEKFLCRLDEWLVGAPDKIEFWGGEPLLYLKQLKLLAPALRAKFPASEFLIITNGALLTDEIVSFLVEHDFNVAVSHDGPAQSVRGEDPLLKPVVLSAVKRLIKDRPGQFSINTVLSNQNTNIRSIVDWFQARLGADVPFNFEGVVSYYDERTTDSSRLADEQLTQIEDEIFYELSNGTLDYTVFGRKLDLFIESLQQPITRESMYSKCGMDRPDHIAVDLTGAITTCQNTGASGEHYVGSVYDLRNTALKSSTHFSHRNNCSGCAMLRICGGSCMYQHGRDFDESCRADYAQAMGVFKAAVWRIFNKAVTRLEKYADNQIPIKQL